MYLIISWFYSLGKISGIVPEPKLKNWKTEFSREIQEEILHMDSVFQFFSFSVLLTELFRNISGDISEYLRRNWKTEKQKNWKTEFSREIQEEILHMDSVFLFFSFSVLLTELFRNISGDISEYLRRKKNWKTEFSREIQEEILHMDSVFQFFSFSVLLTELFRNISGDISEYLRRNWKKKNWKTEFSREIQEEILHMDSVFQFFCFSVFQFCLRNYSGIFPETFQNICGETEKQKNWKTEFPERSRKRFSIWIHFFSFSVFQFCLRNYSGIFPETFAEKLKNWIFQRDPGRDFQMDSVFQFLSFVAE